MTDVLFQPYALNNTLTLQNRIIMAPLTRCMADDELVPTQAMQDYYARRAETGLIITEATSIRADAQGYPNVPGIYTPAQIAGWKRVTDAVHAKGGKIFLQIWHTGRVSHSFFHGGDVLAPSALAAEGSVPRMRELAYELPKPATKTDIEKLVHDFGQAAENAREAGFDGVELHGANGYLIDQFLHYDTNQREDEYGGSPENMIRFALDVVDEVTRRIGADRVGLRLSPGAYFGLKGDPRDRAVFDHLLPALEARALAYLHVGIFDDSMIFDDLGGTASAYIRSHYNNTLIGVGSYTADTGRQAIEGDKFDLLAIGRPLIANPDYVNKVRENAPLTDYAESMLAELV